MSNRATTWAWDVEGLSPTQKLVLVKLADNANDDGYCWPSRRYLMKHTCLSDGAVKNAVRELERRGLISVIRRKVEESVNLPNHYQLELANMPNGRGVGQEMPHPGSGDALPGASDAHKPSIEPSIEPIDLSPAVAGPIPTDDPPSKPAASRYRWSGKIIRLTERDFDRWAEIFSYLDLPPELESLDAWLGSPDATEAHRKGWFHVVAGALKNRNGAERAKRQSANGSPRPKRRSTLDAAPGALYADLF